MELFDMAPGELDLLLHILMGICFGISGLFYVGYFIHKTPKKIVEFQRKSSNIIFIVGWILFILALIT